MLMHLLPLVLVGALTCDASSFYGPGGGRSFLLRGNPGEKISALRLYVAPLHLKGVQVRYGSVWSEKQQTLLARWEEFDLEDGEYITKVSGSYSQCLRHLSFTTSMGRHIQFGVPGRYLFSASPPELSMGLSSISGQMSWMCLTSLAFNWAKMETSTPPKPSASSTTSPPPGISVSRSTTMSTSSPTSEGTSPPTPEDTCFSSFTPEDTSSSSPTSAPTSEPLEEQEP